LPNFPVAQFSAAHFLVAVFPWSFPFSLFQTILCCPVFLPSHFSLPIFPIAQFSGSHFFRCRFFSCLFSVAVFAVNRPSVSFIDRQQQRRPAAGLLVSDLWAGHIDR